MPENFLPYGRQMVDDDDIAAVAGVLRSDWLTTGPMVENFEQGICQLTGAAYGVAVSSGTAALHASMHALGIGPGDEVIVPPITFAATANAVLYQGALPVFADVDAATLLINPAAVEDSISPRTKAIIGVDYAGQPCDWDALQALACKHNLALVADACHALGAALNSRNVGTLADITCFSFHPVKHITTGEGGMVVTQDETLARRMRSFRAHGIDSSASQREKAGIWHYDMTSLGFNYRISDVQCALGLSQLAKLPRWLARRRELAALYDELLPSHVTQLTTRNGVEHAWHLYVIRHPNRDNAFTAMRAAGIGVNVHYTPVHLQSYYRTTLGTGEGLCPVAEAAYAQILTLPLWPGMRNDDVLRVVQALGAY